MGYWGYPKYATNADLRNMAAASSRRLQKKGLVPDPIEVSTTRGKVTTSWWGDAWSENLERYADYANRIDRGKRYLRSGAVFDLKIKPGHVDAWVQGSRKSPYEVSVDIDPLSEEQREKIVAQCQGHLESLEQLVSGKFPEELAHLFTQKGGLFPAPKEIHFDCSCPDWASMCKHVAATLYGIGVRLDRNPLLLFELRGLDPNELIDTAIGNRLEQMLSNAEKDSPRIIKDDDWQKMFSL